MHAEQYWYAFFNIHGRKTGFRIRLKNRDYILYKSILRQENLHCSFRQSATAKSFSYKWRQQASYASSRVRAASRKWLLERYANNIQSALDLWTFKGCRFLDAGCGSGYSCSLLFGKRLNRVHYLGVDISDAVDLAAMEFKRRNISGEFMQADIVHLPVGPGTFDTIFSEGVLHHTDSTERAIKYLASLLCPGGYFLFYVYAKKGPIREFSDD